VADDPASRSVLGRLSSAPRAGGPFSKVWTVLAYAYAGTGVALHLAFGAWFALGLYVEPWWYVALVLAVWAAIWVPIVRVWRRQPGMVAFLVLGADLVLFFTAGAIADGVGWI
jgi:hypothetical protein